MLLLALFISCLDRGLLVYFPYERGSWGLFFVDLDII